MIDLTQIIKWLTWCHSSSCEAFGVNISLLWIHENYDAIAIDLLPKSHHAPVPYITMRHVVIEMCSCLLLNGAFWDICLMHCEICEMEMEILNDAQQNRLHILWNILQYSENSSRWSVSDHFRNSVSIVSAFFFHFERRFRAFVFYCPGLYKRCVCEVGE